MTVSISRGKSSEMSWQRKHENVEWFSGRLTPTIYFMIMQKISLWIKSYRKMHGLIKKSFFQQTEREFTHGTSFHIIHRRMVRKEWNHCIRQIWIVSVERLKHWQYREFLHKRAVDSETNEKRNWKESSWFQLNSKKITKQKFPFWGWVWNCWIVFFAKDVPQNFFLSSKCSTQKFQTWDKIFSCNLHPMQRNNF